MSSYPRERILDIDETNSSSEKGTESVNCHIDNSEKEGVKVITAIEAAGKNLPLTLIGKGKTERCFAGFHVPDEVWETFSQSEWITSEVMPDYLL
jgi:hypothetical protein